MRLEQSMSQLQEILQVSAEAVDDHGEHKREAAHGLDRVTTFSGRKRHMSSPILPIEGPSGPSTLTAAGTSTGRQRHRRVRRPSSRHRAKRRSTSSRAGAARRPRCSSRSPPPAGSRSSCATSGHQLRFSRGRRRRAHERRAPRPRRQRRADAVGGRGARAGGRKAAGVGRRRCPPHRSASTPQPAPRSRSRALPRAWKRAKIIAALMGGRTRARHAPDRRAGEAAGRAGAAAERPEQPPAARRSRPPNSACRRCSKARRR